MSLRMWGLSGDDLKEISERFLTVFENHTGRPFPEDPFDQLEIAIKAVFGSWDGKRGGGLPPRIQYHT